MSWMIFRILGKYEDIVQVDDKFLQKLAKYINEEVLERSRGVGEAERHNVEPEVAERGTERRLPLVAFFDSNEVIGRS
jgi:hypothetical protein